MMVNNETGAVMPIADMVKAVHRASRWRCSIPTPCRAF